jgi:hypothetical protein
VVTAKKAPAKSKAGEATSAKKTVAPSAVRPVGRPTKWKDEFVDLAFKFCLMGATDKKLGEFFDVDERTINDWKETKPEFSQSIFNGREKADADIAESLYHRARGYKHKDTDIRVVNGTIVQTELVKEYPPDTAAASLWLRNRQGRLWREKQELEHSGGLTIDKMPDDVLADRMAELMARMQAK